MTASTTKPTPSLIVGWRERLDVPALGLVQLQCKVDTGAKTSALHANDIEVDGDLVRFRLPEAQDPSTRPLELPVHEMRWVKSSNGIEEQRPLVRLDLILGGIRWPANVTLTARGDMRFPMLLGREALRGRFLVDPQRSFVQSAKQKKTPA